MRLIPAILMAAVLILNFSSPVYPLEYEYKEYQVEQGDTLWTISEKELQGSFQWPFLWKENPDIKNPDKIFPGQKIKIPSGEKSPAEMTPQPQAEAPASEQVKTEPLPAKAITPVPPVFTAKPLEPEPLEQTIEPMKKEAIIERRDMLYAGYISKTIPELGEIVGSPRKGGYFGNEDEVYIKVQGNANPDDRFYIIRKEQNVTFPGDKKPTGFVISIIGSLIINKQTEDGIKARINEAFTEVAIGDKLEPYYDIDVPFLLEEPRTPDITAIVLATKFNKQLSGQKDIIHINKGANDGLEPGDMLMTLMPGTKSQTNGKIQIINTRDFTSTAVILISNIEIRRGDAIVGVKR